MEKPKFGDRVEVHFSKSSYVGILLESSDSGIYLIKLDSGYNVGINKKEIIRVDVLERGKEGETLKEIKEIKDSKKKNIALIITGGTIASKYDSKTGGVKYLTKIYDFLSFYPEIKEIANVTKIENPFMVWSEDMSFKEWIKIGKTCEKLLNDSNISGVIITHGTDFLHYTSAALSFFLGKLNKPVVLTCSQRSVDRGSSDARLNLICAAKLAISDIADVSLVSHGSSSDDFCYAFPGTKVRKLHTSKRDAFKIVNSTPFARIDLERIEILREYNKRNKNKVKGDFSFEGKVGLVKFYPGQNPEILDYYFERGYKGIVVEFAGIGQVAVESEHSWLKKIKELSSKGFVICAAAQTIFGRLDPYVYSSGRKLQEAGVIYLKDMLAETALVKLGWVLGHKNWNVKEKMLENVVGEFNKRLN